MVRRAVLPQVLPNYVAFSLYIFELNIRASTVIGIVGAGGIGNLLNTQMKFFNFDNVRSSWCWSCSCWCFVIELVSVRSDDGWSDASTARRQQASNLRRNRRIDGATWCCWASCGVRLVDREPRLQARPARRAAGEAVGLF